jgi:hypothetical protein
MLIILILENNHLSMKIGLLLIALLLPLSVSAQQRCQVLMPDLDSVYQGKCKDGIANGSGEAWGRFHYKGKFVNGYPEGMGRADYRNGTVYDGQWEKGQKNGKGTLYINMNGKVIEKHGIWQNDSLQKEILPPPYKVITQRNINRVRVYREGNGTTVWFFPNATGGMATEPEDIQLAGNSGSTIFSMPRVGYEDVIFPFQGSIRYKAWNKLRTAQIEILLEIEISQPGSWVVEIQN